MATTRRRRTLAERLSQIEEDRRRLTKAKLREDAQTKRASEAAELADETLRGCVSERRRKAAWGDHPLRAEAELKVLDEELTDAHERRVFGLPPLAAPVGPAGPTEDETFSPAGS